LGLREASTSTTRPVALVVIDTVSSTARNHRRVMRTPTRTGSKMSSPTIALLLPGANKSNTNAAAAHD
jgi:hypothetical protein